MLLFYVAKTDRYSGHCTKGQVRTHHLHVTHKGDAHDGAEVGAGAAVIPRSRSGQPLDGTDAADGRRLGARQCSSAAVRPTHRVTLRRSDPVPPLGFRSLLGFRPENDTKAQISGFIISIFDIENFCVRKLAPTNMALARGTPVAWAIPLACIVQPKRSLCGESSKELVLLALLERPVQPTGTFCSGRCKEAVSLALGKGPAPAERSVCGGVVPVRGRRASCRSDVGRGVLRRRPPPWFLNFTRARKSQLHVPVCFVKLR